MPVEVPRLALRSSSLLMRWASVLMTVYPDSSREARRDLVAFRLPVVGALAVIAFPRGEVFRV